MSDLLITHDEGVATLQLNRPQRRHALSLSLLQQLDQALTQLGDDRSVRVIVLTSSGPVFCSGHDLGEMTEQPAEAYQELFATCSRVMQRIHQVPQPVIAKVQGFATAAGCQLVAACDLAVAVDQAQFATPGVKIGLFCTTPMVPLVRNIAPKLAMEMLLTGKPINAQQALAAGLVNRVVPEDQLDAAVAELTTAICQSSSLTIAMGKRAFYDQLPLDESTAYDRAVHVMTENAVTHDAQEGISAFLQKRPPQWTGE
ncbi:MAG: enoyl-CoA hydratase [Planctomycetaceae bacterium]|nr:enoyl-CoA hydratase [Planctomycetaceae bacterium]